MSTQRTMTLTRVAVETYMFGEKMSERVERRVVPVTELENGRKYPFEAAIFVARNTERPGNVVQSSHFLQVAVSDRCEISRFRLLDRVHFKHSSHEFVMVHLFSGIGYSRPGRKVV